MDFQALDPKFVLTLEPKVWKLEGSSFGHKPSIYVLKGKYDETLQTNSTKLSVPLSEVAHNIQLEPAAPFKTPTQVQT